MQNALEEMGTTACQGSRAPLFHYIGWDKAMRIAETGTTLRACMHFNQRMFQAFKFSFICYMYGNTTLLQQAPLNLFSVELTADTSHVVD